MKTFIVTLATALVTIFFLSQPAHAAGLVLMRDSDSIETKALTDAKMLLQRLDIIHAIDKNHLSVAEKKRLRKESRMIKSHLNEFDTANYIPLRFIIIVLFVPLVVFQAIE